MLPTDSPGDRRRKFVKENGDCILDENKCWHIFSNGALMERNIMGAFTPAFTDANSNDSRLIKQTLRNRLYYSQKRLGAAIRAFETMKAELESRANSSFAAGSYPPTENEIQKLYDAKTEVEKYQTMVSAVELELNPPKPPAQQRVIDPAVREKSKAVLETIKSIEV